MSVITQLKYSCDGSPGSVLFSTDHPAPPATLDSCFDPSEESRIIHFSLLPEKLSIQNCL